MLVNKVYDIFVCMLFKIVEDVFILYYVLLEIFCFSLERLVF